MRRCRGIAVLAAAAVALGGCDLNPRTAVLPGGTGTDGYEVHATFADVDNLVDNSAVQYHDVRVGTVTAVALDHRTWRADVTLRLGKGVGVPRGATARIGQTSLLGAEFVELDDPAGPRNSTASVLRDGDRIGESHTGAYPGTEEVLSAVSLLLNNGGLSQIRTITTQLSDALAGRTGDARSLLRRLTTFVGDVDAQKRKLIATAQSLNSLSGKLADDRTTLARALQHITPAVGTLDTDRPDLTSALKALTQLSTVATKVITRNRAHLAGDLAALNPTLTKLAQTGKDLPDSLPLLVSFPFPITTLHNAIRGDYLNLFETLDISVSSVQRDFLYNVPIVGGAPITDAKNPLLAPVQAVDGSTTPRPTPSPSPSTTPSSPSATPSPSTPSPTPTPTSCALINQVLGGC